jgi:hypothetical protein
MARKRSRGATQHRNTKGARHRGDHPRNLWLRPAKPYRLGQESWKVLCLRREKALDARLLVLDDFVESLTWTDSQASLSGTLLYRQPEKKRLRVREGNLIVLMWRPGPSGAWRELWQLRAHDLDETASDGSVTVNLQSELERLKASKDDFSYRKGKHRHRKGWKPQQITRDVCGRYGVLVGKLARGPKDYRISSLVKEGASPLDTITEAYDRLAKETEKKYVVEMRANRLTVRPLTYGKYLTEIGDLLTEASYQEGMKQGLKTALTVRGKGGAKSVEVDVVDRKLTRRFGLIHDFMDDPDGDTRQKARRHGRKEIKRNKKPDRTVALTHPGIPVLSRGDAIRVQLGAEFSLRRVCYVTSVTHNLSVGDYSMDLEVALDDPYHDEDSARKDRKKKAAKRARKRGHDSSPSDRTRRRPAGHARRS